MLHEGVHPGLLERDLGFTVGVVVRTLGMIFYIGLKIQTKISKDHMKLYMLISEYVFSNGIFNEVKVTFRWRRMVLKVSIIYKIKFVLLAKNPICIKYFHMDIYHFRINCVKYTTKKC